MAPYGHSTILRSRSVLFVMVIPSLESISATNTAKKKSCRAPARNLSSLLARPHAGMTRNELAVGDCSEQNKLCFYGSGEFRTASHASASISACPDHEITLAAVRETWPARPASGAVFGARAMVPSAG